MAGPAKVISEGLKIPYTPASAVEAGDVIALDNGVGVVEGDLAANELGSLIVEGIIRFPKGTGSASALATLFTKLYWDATNEIVTTTAGSNKVAGYSAQIVDTDDETVEVKLDHV